MRILNLINLVSVWWFIVVQIPDFKFPDETVDLYEVGHTWNASFPNDFSKHVWYNNILINFHMGFIHLFMFCFASPLMEKVNAIGHIIYWTYGQRWLHSKFPISDKYDYSKMVTPAAICMYVVPLAYAIGLGLDMTVEIACHIRMCCCKGKTAVDENKNK